MGMWPCQLAFCMLVMEAAILTNSIDIIVEDVERSGTIETALLLDSRYLYGLKAFDRSFVLDSEKNYCFWTKEVIRRFSLPSSFPELVIIRLATQHAIAFIGAYPAQQ